MKLKNYIIALLSVVSFGILQSCSDDDKNISAKAVLASVSSLEYDGLSPQPLTFTVVSDANWYSEASDWVTISPATGGAGQTEVTVSVTDNLRDGSLDNPRTGKAVFRGNTLASVYEVVIYQDGDKFRDISSYLISDLGSVDDGTVVEVNDLIVTAVGTTGFMATDGTDNLLVMYSESSADADEVTPGDKLDIEGEKQHDSSNLPYIYGEKFLNKSAGSVPEITYEDITDVVDTYNANTRKPITVTGFYDAGYLEVDGQSYKIGITDAPEEFKNADLNAHDIVLTGYYCGTMAPVVNIFVTSYEDLGLRETIYFFEDFEWLEEWGTTAEDCVGTDNLSASSPAMTTTTAVIDGVEWTLFNYFEQVKGYTFLHDKNDSNYGLYINKNYLKMGKTGYHCGVTLPSLDVEAGTPLVLQFDWCAMRQGSGKIDPVTLYVEVNAGGSVYTYDIPELGWDTGHTLEWVRAEVDLSECAIDKSATITITQNEWGVTTANRWFIDNIKIKNAN